MKDSQFCLLYKDKSLTDDYANCSEEERGHNEHDEEAQIP